MNQKLLATSVAALLGTVSMQAQAVNVFENLSSSGTPVAFVCQGVQEPDPVEVPPAANRCRLIGGTLPVNSTCATATSFPGIGGAWIRIRNSANQNMSANGTVVGRLTDSVWQRCSAVGGTAQNDYIFGMQVEILSAVANRWTEPADDNMGLAGTNGCNSETGKVFEVNDMFRRGGANTTSNGGFFNITNVSTAYRIATAGVEEGAWRSSRTQQGLASLLVANPGNPLAGRVDPARDNNWVNWRTDASPADTDGTAPSKSAFMFTRVTLAAGQSIPTTKLTNGIRIEEGGEEGQCKFRIQMPAFHMTP
jgi:hypothetical protein